jgi:hypothetical protein
MRPHWFHLQEWIALVFRVRCTCGSRIYRSNQTRPNLTALGFACTVSQDEHSSGGVAPPQKSEQVPGTRQKRLSARSRGSPPTIQRTGSRSPRSHTTAGPTATWTCGWTTIQSPSSGSRASSTCTTQDKPPGSWLAKLARYTGLSSRSVKRHGCTSFWVAGYKKAL